MRLTVPSTTYSLAAISALDSPAPTSPTTSRSRPLKPSNLVRALTARSSRPPTWRWVMMRWATSGERYAAPAETARTPAISSRACA